MRSSLTVNLTVKNRGSHPGNFYRQAETDGDGKNSGKSINKNKHLEHL
jgi:hypothetical protein